MILDINPKVFLPVYLPHLDDYEKRYNVYYGGRGSGKTIFVFQKLLLKGLKEKRNILLMRKTTVSCKFSVWKELKDAISSFGLNKYFSFRETDFTAECKLNGTIFKCSGLDNPERIKGYSEISDVVLEEATEFNLEDFELIDGTVRSIKYSLPLQIYCLFNPIAKTNWVYKRFGFDTGIVPDNTFILKTTYLDNPHLSQDYIERMENMKKTNPTRWKIEALGDFVSLDRLIFQNYKVEDFDYTTIKGQLLVGMDFGFITDPSAIVASILDEVNKKIYIFREWSGQGYTNQQLVKVIESLGFSKSVIVADSAEQKSIAEIRQGGIIKIRPAIKGSDSVIHGLQQLMNYEIIVHPTCEGVLVEFENYTWQKDKQTGEYINKPIDQFNHFCDSLRYSLQCVSNRLKSFDRNVL